MLRRAMGGRRGRAAINRISKTAAASKSVGVPMIAVRVSNEVATVAPNVMARVMADAMAADHVAIAVRALNVAPGPSVDRLRTADLNVGPDLNAALGQIVDHGLNVGRDRKIGVSQGNSVRIGRGVIGLRASVRNPGKVGAVLRSHRR
jgi:hypothetical protein